MTQRKNSVIDQALDTRVTAVEGDISTFVMQDITDVTYAGGGPQASEFQSVLVGNGTIWQNQTIPTSSGTGSGFFLSKPVYNATPDSHTGKEINYSGGAGTNLTSDMTEIRISYTQEMQHALKEYLQNEVRVGDLLQFRGVSSNDNNEERGIYFRITSTAVIGLTTGQKFGVVPAGVWVNGVETVANSGLEENITVAFEHIAITRIPNNIDTSTPFVDGEFLVADSGVLKNVPPTHGIVNYQGNANTTSNYGTFTWSLAQNVWGPIEAETVTSTEGDRYSMASGKISTLSRVLTWNGNNSASVKFTINAQGSPSPGSSDFEFRIGRSIDGGSTWQNGVNDMPNNTVIQINTTPIGLSGSVKVIYSDGGTGWCDTGDKFRLEGRHTTTGSVDFNITVAGFQIEVVPWSTFDP